jgi:hypothetical protein
MVSNFSRCLLFVHPRILSHQAFHGLFLFPTVVPALVRFIRSPDANATIFVLGNSYFHFAFLFTVKQAYQNNVNDADFSLEQNPSRSIGSFQAPVLVPAVVSHTRSVSFVLSMAFG